MPNGKYFYITSKLNGLVLDVQGESHAPGTPVITWPKKDGYHDNQLWYEDPLVGVIRSKLNHLCLDVNDDGAVVLQEVEAGKDNQQWLTSGDRIQNQRDSSRVLDIKCAEMSEGAPVIVWESHDGDNQRWSFDYAPAQYFYIVSAMHGKVMDTKEGSGEAGTKVVLHERSAEPRDSQLWYEDKFGVVCNKLNNFVLDSSHEGKIVLQPDEPGDTNQLWTIQANRIINRTKPSCVLDIKGAKHKNGAKVISWPWHGKDNQCWSFEYV